MIHASWMCPRASRTRVRGGAPSVLTASVDGSVYRDSESRGDSCRVGVEGPWLRDAKAVEECVAQIAEKRPDLTYFAPAEVDVRWDQCLGEGGFCTAYLAEWEGGGCRTRRQRKPCTLPTPSCVAFPRDSFYLPAPLLHSRVRSPTRRACDGGRVNLYA